MPKSRPATSTTQQSHEERTISSVNTSPTSELVDSRSGEVRIPHQQCAELEFKDDQGRLVTENVEISDISCRGLSIRLSRELVVDQPAWIRFDSTKSKCMVRHCRKTEEGFTAGLFVVRKERRRSDREPMSGSAVMDWTGGPSGNHETKVSVQNISSDGIQVVSPEPIPAHTPVRLRGREYECQGVTWYCGPVQEGYRIGIQFSRPPYERSSPSFKE